MTKIFKLFFIFILFSACSSTSDEQAPKQLYFFDLAGYFKTQATVLPQQAILKTVSKNGIPETKNIVIKDWNQELQLFIQSDINKAAWKDSYRKDSTENILHYVAIDTALRVRSIRIAFENDVPNEVIIHTQSKNVLYHTTEDLTYIPDSLYQITKHQKVILLGLNDYQITGKLK